MIVDVSKLKSLKNWPGSSIQKAHDSGGVTADDIEHELRAWDSVIHTDLHPDDAIWVDTLIDIQCEIEEPFEYPEDKGLSSASVSLVFAGRLDDDKIRAVVNALRDVQWSAIVGKIGPDSTEIVATNISVRNL